MVKLELCNLLIQLRLTQRQITQRQVIQPQKQIIIIIKIIKIELLKITFWQQKVIFCLFNNIFQIVDLI